MPDGPVLYAARVVPNYRIPVLERLNERLGGRLIVGAGQPVGSSSLNYLIPGGEPSYRQVPLRNYWLFGERIHAQPFRGLFGEGGDPSVLLAEESPRSITLPFLLRHAKKLGAGRVLWGHFSSLNRTFDPRRHLQDRYRVAMARRVEACACYTQGVADQLRPFVEEDKVFVARNTMDLDPMFAQYDNLAKEGKAAVRKRLGLPADVPILVFMGRLIPEKGTSMLLETFTRLRADGTVILLVIGDGPMRSSMEDYGAREGLDGIHYLGWLDEEAAPYLYAADIMVVPGYLGLVINHAFAFGLPIVSFRRPIGTSSHSPEIEYLRSGENGLLSSGDTANQLCLSIKAVVDDLARYSHNAHAYARKHLTIDRMVDGLYRAICYAEEQRFT